MANDKRTIISSPRIEELKRRQKKHRKILAILYFIFFIGLVVGLSYLSRFHKFVITNVEVNGTHIIDSTLVKEEVLKDISGKYMYIFNRNSAFIYPHKKLEENLPHTFPRIKSIDISRKGFSTLVVNINERIGSYLWCGATVPENIDEGGEDCYFINSDGYIFDKSPYFSGNVYFKFYVPIEGAENPLEKQVLEQSVFQQIISFIDGLDELGLHAVSVDMNNGDKYAFHLESSTIEPLIYFSKDNDLRKIFQNLSAAMQKKEFKNEIFSKYDTLMYIDLRFDNKVLYKLQ